LYRKHAQVSCFFNFKVSFVHIKFTTSSTCLSTIFIEQFHRKHGRSCPGKQDPHTLRSFEWINLIQKVKNNPNQKQHLRFLHRSFPSSLQSSYSITCICPLVLCWKIHAHSWESTENLGVFGRIMKSMWKANFGNFLLKNSNLKVSTRIRYPHFYQNETS